MKTILERAKEAVIDPFDPDEMLPVRMGYLSMLERRGFVAGAMSELNELLRWHKIQSDKSGFATDEALDESFFGNCHVLSKTSGTGASNSSTMIMPLNGEAIWNANRAYTNGGLFTK